MIKAIFVLELAVVLGEPPSNSSQSPLDQTALHVPAEIPMKVEFPKNKPTLQQQKAIRSAKMPG